jgi:hypothetical protein
LEVLTVQDTRGRGREENELTSAIGPSSGVDAFTVGKVRGPRDELHGRSAQSCPVATRHHMSKHLVSLFQDKGENPVMRRRKSQPGLTLLDCVRPSSADG